MRLGAALGGVVALAGLVLGACTVSTSPSGAYACSAATGCPSGYVCLAEQCVEVASPTDGPMVPDAPPGSPDGPRPPDAASGVDASGRADAPPGPADAAGGCLLEESFSAPIDSFKFAVTSSGGGTAQATGGVLDLDVAGGGLISVETLAPLNVVGQTVTLEVPSYPSFYGSFGFRVHWNDGSDDVSLGFTGSFLSFSAQGECPTCPGASNKTFCESASSSDGDAYRYLRLVVGTPTLLQTSGDGAAWTTRSSCAEHLVGLTAASIEIVLEPVSGSVPASTASADDLTVCPTP